MKHKLKTIILVILFSQGTFADTTTTTTTTITAQPCNIDVSQMQQNIPITRCVDGYSHGIVTVGTPQSDQTTQPPTCSAPCSYPDDEAPQQICTWQQGNWRTTLACTSKP